MHDLDQLLLVVFMANELVMEGQMMDKRVEVVNCVDDLRARSLGTLPSPSSTVNCCPFFAPITRSKWYVIPQDVLHAITNLYHHLTVDLACALK